MVSEEPPPWPPAVAPDLARSTATTAFSCSVQSFSSFSESQRAWAAEAGAQNGLTRSKGLSPYLSSESLPRCPHTTLERVFI